MSLTLLGYLAATILAILAAFIPQRFLLPAAVILMGIMELIDHGVKG